MADDTVAEMHARAAIGQLDRLRRDVGVLIANWREASDAIEELSKIENGGDVSETVAGAASQLRRCASQLSSVAVTPLLDEPDVAPKGG